MVNKLVDLDTFSLNGKYDLYYERGDSNQRRIVTDVVINLKSNLLVCTDIKENVNVIVNRPYHLIEVKDTDKKEE